jgi:hypothetical protein
MITSERLRELLHYEPDIGTWTWLKSGNGRRANLVAGRIDFYGYRNIGIEGRPYKAHRLAWFYVTGAWPKGELDHINGDKGDNRWANLREANRSQNEANKLVRSNNTSGFKGVSWSRDLRKWRAYISGKQIHLGCFDTPHQAYAKYCLAARQHFGEFARCYEADQLIIPRKVFEGRVLRNLLKATQREFTEAA